MALWPILALLGTAAAWAPQEPAPQAQEERKIDQEVLLQQLANPLAALASLKMDMDLDYHVGPAREGHRSALALLPTIPIHLGDEWNIVSRSIVPFVYQEDIAPGTGAQLGVGDLTEVLYVAMVKPGKRGWIFGFGPLVRMPTGTDDLLTQGKWSLGPSAALVRQLDEFTLGLIATQIWSVGGSSQRADIELGILEPFLTYRAEGLWNLSLHVPFSFDYHARQWIIPVELTVEKLVSFQRLPITISFGVRYWADGPDSGPHDLAFTFGLTVVFPN